MPKVSVVMPVYNCEKYVGEAIQSILDQTFTDFELIIVDDGSTDESLEIITKYIQKDKRIKLFQNKVNSGIVFTRNRLFSLCDSSALYMAIIDADDRAMSTRLEKQVEYLDKNEDISVLGSGIYIINKDGERVACRLYPGVNDIHLSILKRSPIAQPSACIRISSFFEVGGYVSSYERVEDYKLCLDLYTQGYKIHNLSDFLTEYRVFDGQGKTTHLKHTLLNTIRVQSEYIFNRQYFSLSCFFYWCGECILYIFPSAFILYLFKRISYTGLQENELN